MWQLIRLSTVINNISIYSYGLISYLFNNCLLIKNTLTGYLKSLNDYLRANLLERNY